MNNNVLILGAGRGQIDLIKAALKYGFNPIIASIPGNYPGLKMGVEWIDVDITNRDKVLSLAREKKIKGIAAACMDLGIPTLGYICDQMGLSGLSASAAERCNNKFLMKDAFIKHGVNTARYRKVRSEEELRNTVLEFGYPIIIKAVDLQGSRGINIVREEKDILAAYRNTMSETAESFCIVEEFIEGYEFGAQAFIAEGEVLFILPCGDISFCGRTNIPVGHYVPLNLGENVAQKVQQQAQLAIRAVGLNNCAVNIDLIERDGDIYVIELTGRIGANCLPQLTSIYYGIDIYKMILDMAVGKNPRAYFLENKQDLCACGYAKMLYSEKNGVLKKIIDNNRIDEDVEEIQFFVQPGCAINAFSNSRDCIGQIVVKGKSIQDCEMLIDKVISNIEIEIEDTYE